jgi:hypothetical protein
VFQGWVGLGWGIITPVILSFGAKRLLAINATGAFPL